MIVGWYNKHNLALQVRGPDFEIELYHLLAVWFGLSQFTSLRAIFKSAKFLSQDHWWVKHITDVMLPWRSLQILAIVIVAWVLPCWNNEHTSVRSNSVGIAVDRVNWSNHKIAIQRTIAQVNEVSWEKDNRGKIVTARKRVFDFQEMSWSPKRILGRHGCELVK